MPLGLCHWVKVSYSVQDKLDQDETKRFCVSVSAAFAPTEYKITKGDTDNPQQINIQDVLLVDIENKRPTAVLFLESQNSCQQLEIK